MTDQIKKKKNQLYETVLVRVLQRNGTNRMDGSLAIGSHIMEAKKFHNLLSTSWRTRKDGGVIESESKDLSTIGANRVSSS